MKLLNRIAVAVFAAACLLLVSPPARAAQLPEDPKILKGKLDNGVSWIYRQHNNPPGKMALKIHVRTGSLNETGEQRGLAHFLEHMAFNGTEHFPPGKLVPYFESIGMQFGADLNAFTSFDQTVYMLYTPDTEPEQIDKALMVLSDYAFRDSLLEEEVNKERGIVLEEARSRKNASQRIRDKLWPELFKGSRFADRLPIGLEEIIAKAPRKEFEDYYRLWYRPENITVVLVGDAPPDKYIPLIKKWFGEYKAPGEAKKPAGPEFTPFGQERAIVVTDPEMAYCQLQMLNLLPGRPAAVTVEQSRIDLVEYIGGWIINRRMDERVKKGEASYRGAGASVDNFFHDAMLVVGSAVGEAKEWDKMVTEVIADIGRAREFGFTEREMNLARKEILAEAERAVRTESTRSAHAVIDEIMGAVNERTPVPSAQQTLDLYKQLLPGIDVKEVSTAFRDNFKPGSFAYVLTMADKEGVKVPSREEVLATAKAALAQKLAQVSESDTPTNLLAALPAPGKVVETTVDKDLGVTSAVLDNGARVHHRFMDYKKDSIMVSISLAGGNIEETAANAGITQVASIVLAEPATSRLPSTAVRDLMTGKNIGVTGAAAGDHFNISVTGSPLDLETGLQLAHALLTDGKIEEAAFKNWRLNTLQQMEQREKAPIFKAQEAMEDLMSNGDPRRVFVKKAQVQAMTLSAAQAWFERIAKTGPLEIAVVGDMKWEDVLPLIQRYLGSLPKREWNLAKVNSLRASPRKDGPLERSVKVETVTPQAVALAGFAASEGKNTADTRALELISNMLSSRLIKKIREEMAIVYSIHASSVPSWIYEDAGRFYSGAPCDPANAARVAEEIHKVFAEFGEKGPTAEELANAKKQIANTLDVSMREPSYWWSILRTLDLRGRNLDAEKTILRDYAAFTTEQILATFNKYYTPKRKFQVTAIPTGGPKAAAPEPKKEAAAK